MLLWLRLLEIRILLLWWLYQLYILLLVMLHLRIRISLGLHRQFLLIMSHQRIWTRAIRTILHIILYILLYLYILLLYILLLHLLLLQIIWAILLAIMLTIPPLTLKYIRSTMSLWRIRERLCIINFIWLLFDIRCILLIPIHCSRCHIVPLCS